jgi:hypothetical protein
MDESPLEKYNRIQRDIQAAILKNYPNPERKGCPGRSVVDAFASSPERITADDDANPESEWFHVTHCSPCYAEFLDSRNAFRRRRVQERLTRRTIIAASTALCAGGLGWLVWQRNQPRTVEIDFERYMSTRGADGGVPPGRLTLPTGRLHIRLRLPKDSAPGLYSVQLSKEADLSPIFSASANTVSEGTTQTLAFDVMVDASPGNCALGVRSDHRGVWRYIPIVLATR